MFAEERVAQILEWLQKNRKVTVLELSQNFAVSGATIRHDLRQMESEGLLKRVHGGAILSQKTGVKQPFQQRKQLQPQAKNLIAKVAVTMIEEGDTIIFDSGTTTLELAKQIKGNQHLTVITNDLEIAQLLEGKQKIQVILLGGAVMKDYHCTFGAFAVKMLAELSADKVFLATNCFSLEKGCSTHGIHQTETKRAMIASASEVIVLCDHSKIGKNALSQFADLDQLDTLITDQVTTDLKKALEEQGIKVIEAEK
ncbi:MAG: hypothetical protein COB67_04020 [SAR324 cluster bacterium]|uniref:HTH deoR-type domain-containing protein n=1 Tax=SAR324 cluster bacterium TaxID=2024889 RepID=A0A2A4T810_9DELT|nr:MAG: hypothetical protein COB67_04020 [SAR324 cluster bacterium]